MYSMDIEEVDIASPSMEGSFEAAVFASTAWQAGGAQAEEHPEAAQVDASLNFRLVAGAGVRDVSDDKSTLDALEARRVAQEEARHSAAQAADADENGFATVQQGLGRDEL
jgi:hypothetical protein